MNELFWQVTENERQQGYVLDNDKYNCLLCHYEIEDGEIYQVDERFYEAKKMIKMHIEKEHGSVFEFLLNLDKKETGLSDHQTNLLKLFYEGKSDYEIQKDMKIGSLSTIRNHRFALKEKEKQAKMTSTILGIFHSSQKNAKPIKPHKTAKMVDDRYVVTEEEAAQIIDKYFAQDDSGQLKTFAVKEKYKIIILREIMKHFEEGFRYTEAEVDTVLKAIYEEDHAVLRRYLIQYGFMDREKDGSAYWVKASENSIKKSKKQDKNKDVDAINKEEKKRAMKRQYKTELAEKKTVSGVYQIKNLVNNKIYIGSTRNVENLNGLVFQLNMGSFMNSELQKDWTVFGSEKFELSVLESFEEEEPVGLVTKKMRALEKQWREKLKPYGELGYHRNVNEFF